MKGIRSAQIVIPEASEIGEKKREEYLTKCRQDIFKRKETIFSDYDMVFYCDLGMSKSMKSILKEASLSFDKIDVRFIKDE